LRSLSLLDSNGSITQLFNYIQNELKEKDLPIPEMYTIGHPTISFIQKSVPITWKNGRIYRHSFMSTIHDMLIQGRNRFFCLVGEKGVGKTTLCHFFASEKLKISYFSFAKEKFSDFKIYSDFIVLDDVDNLKQSQLNALLKISVKEKVRFLLFSKRPLKSVVDEKFKSVLMDINIPIFSREEGKELIKHYKPELSEIQAEWHYLVSKANPSRILFPQDQLAWENQLYRARLGCVNFNHAASPIEENV
jgi:AAA+ ATPase superfamily predicted ATPase